ncbi:LOW QUALITY PROTEIN: BCL2/adenovirus E1B 19 kDa protein-interacting protein 3-like [Lampetra fluviatilis]
MMMLLVPGSWVELQGGSCGSAPASAFNGEMERILLDAQRESGASSSRSSSTHCDSPPLVPSPRGGLVTETDADKSSNQSDEDRVERSAEMEALLKKNPEWIWDWSSRPENAPRKELRFQQQQRQQHRVLALEALSMRRSRATQRHTETHRDTQRETQRETHRRDTLTCPPTPYLSRELRFQQQQRQQHRVLALEALSMRRSRALQRGGLFSSHFLLLVLPSVVLTHAIALGIGILIGRKLSGGAVSSSSL